MIDVSIDIETLALRQGASIATIGACAVGGAVGVWPDLRNDLFYVVIDDPGGIIEPSCIRWHASQDDPVGNLGIGAVSLEEGLRRLSAWMTENGADEKGEARIWSHATFDVPIIEAAYQRVGLKPPWDYRNCRDLRTLYDLAGGCPPAPNERFHNALSDAKAQMEEIQFCLNRISHD
jgi:exodeoxyribonuclease VIII